MVPNGWKRMLLHQVADVRSGVAKGKSGLKDPILVPYLRVANVQDGHINLDEVKEIEIERHQLERFSLLPGDVLMNEGGDFDKLGRGDVWLGQITPCVHQNHVFSVRPDQERINSFFLAALAASHYGKSYFLSCAKRSTNLASINSSQIKEFPVLVPPIAEQKKIAKILSTWDKAIITTEKLLANSQQQKKVLMQQLLTGKKRLLDKNRIEFSEKWERKPLSRLGDVVGGLTYSPDDVTDESGTLVLRSSNIQNGVLVFDNNVYVRCPVSEKAITKENDILICVRNGSRSLIGKSALLRGKGTGCFHGAFMSVFRTKEPEFVFQLINSTLFYREVRKNLGATINSINGSDLKKFMFNIPNSKEEREKIAAALSAADQEVTSWQQKLNSLKQEKNALMQQLLTGKRRVKVVKAA